jgi:hypothetical protein
MSVTKMIEKYDVSEETLAKKLGCLVLTCICPCVHFNYIYQFQTCS